MEFSGQTALINILSLFFAHFLPAYSVTAFLAASLSPLLSTMVLKYWQNIQARYCTTHICYACNGPLPYISVKSKIM